VILLVLVGLTAVSTFFGVTTERAGYDLAVAEFLQRVDVGPYGDVLFWMGIRGVAGAVMALTCAWLWWRGHRIASVLLVLMLVPDASSFFLRALFERPRPTPDLVMVVGGPQGFSYPSGTALHTMFFYGFMLYMLPRLTSSARVRYGLGSLLVFWILFQGAWVVHHGRHWASDVLGGYLYGAVYLTIWIALYARVTAWDREHPWLLSRIDGLVRRSLARVGVSRR